jgi:hypothetical protein
VEFEDFALERFAEMKAQHALLPPVDIFDGTVVLKRRIG